MMRYSVLVYESAADFLARSDPERRRDYWGAYRHYQRLLEEAGILVGGSALLPTHAATTVRVRDGRTLVQDGPFADSKEQLGGYFEIEVPDLDHALAWATKCPAAAAAVEVRPTTVPPPLDAGD